MNPQLADRLSHFGSVQTQQGADIADIKSAMAAALISANALIPVRLAAVGER